MRQAVRKRYILYLSEIDDAERFYSDQDESAQRAAEVKEDSR